MTLSASGDLKGGKPGVKTASVQNQGSEREEDEKATQTDTEKERERQREKKKGTESKMITLSCSQNKACNKSNSILEQ